MTSQGPQRDVGHGYDGEQQTPLLLADHHSGGGEEQHGYGAIHGARALPAVVAPLVAPDEEVAGDGDGGDGDGAFTRNLGTVEAFAVVISIVIGSGVFTSPGAVDTNMPSPGAALAVWLVGGALAWTGACSLAELGAAIPGEGGVQPYLQRAYGSEVWGFLAAWTWVVAVMPASLAILAIVFVETAFEAAGAGAGRPIARKLLAVLAMVVVGVANSVGTRATTRLNNFFVTAKFVAIAGVAVAGIAVVGFQLAHPDREDVGGRDWFTKPWFGFRESVAPDGSRIDWDAVSGWEMLGYLSAALYGALWAYSGWDKAIYITAELSAPARQLPLAINTAIPTVILCFIAANAAYYILLPWSVVSATDSVAVTAISRLLGSSAGVVAAVLICLVVAGSLLGNSFVAGRMTVAAARKGWLPDFLGYVGHVGMVKAQGATLTTTVIPQGDEPFVAEVEPTAVAADDATSELGDPATTAKVASVAPPDSPSSDAPINANILSTILGALYVLLGNFRALLTFNGLGEYSFFFLTVAGVLVLRRREPDLPRPFKPPLAVPLVFVVVSGFVVVRGAVFAPLQAAVLIGLWAIGVVFFRVRKSWADRAAADA